MHTQNIDIDLSELEAWKLAEGRLLVFLDTSCWIDLADCSSEAARRIRDKLKEGVSSGRMLCPLSWGILEELFKQKGESRERSAQLMEELSLNVTFVMRTELFRWEVDRSVALACGEATAGMRSGLFVPVAAFVGSRMRIRWSSDPPLNSETKTNVEGYLRRKLGGQGVSAISARAGFRASSGPPAYSSAAKRAKELFRGDKKGLFLDESGSIFREYVTPTLFRHSPAAVARWAEHYAQPGDEEAFFRDCLRDLPALYNYIDIMVAVSLQPDRRDKNSDFFDYEIVVAPLAYADVFAFRDAGLLDLLRNRTGILKRSSCVVCDSLEALETWIGDAAN